MAVSTPRKENSSRPIATRLRPTGTRRSTPKRATSFGTCGDSAIITNAIGSWNSPDWSAV